MPKKYVSVLPDSQEPLLVRIRKYFDAQIEYNNLLEKRATICPDEELLDILISLFLDLSEVPKLKASLPKAFIQLHRKELIKEINSDRQMNESLRDQASAENVNFDYLYLKIKLAYKTRLLLIQGLPVKAFEKTLSIFYSGQELKKKTKSVSQGIYEKNVKVPIMAEIQALDEMLKLLEKNISPECAKFVEDAEITEQDRCIFFSIDPMIDSVSKKALKFSKKAPSDQKIVTLIQKYSEAVEVVLTTSSPEKNEAENYIALFENMKIKYQIDDEISNYVKEANHQLQIEDNLKKTASIEVKSKDEIISQFQPIVQKLESQKDSEKPPQQSEEKAIADDTIAHKEDESSSVLLNLETEVTDLKEKENGKDEEVLAPEDSYSVTDYSIFANKDKRKQQQQPEKPPIKRNVLNLNKDQQKTLRELFDIEKYESINLRALVNLAVALKATFHTTGANRCRIEMKTIYAHILVPEQALEKACNSATVTMHGGGHRSSKSQNHDRDKAPGYLIDQFKAAFTRAGYTPANLGLDDVIIQYISSTSTSARG